MQYRVSKKKLKKLKCYYRWNIATVMNHCPKNGQMGDNEHPNKILHKTKHTSSSILSYRVGLDPITTSYLVGWIELSCNIHG